MESTLTSAGRTGRRRPSGEDGFSLMEVLVAFMVLAAVALATTAGLLLSTKISRTNNQRVVAANLASAQVEQLRALGPLAVPVGAQDLPDVTVKGAVYEVRSVAEWQSAPAGTDRCSGAATGTNAYLKATVFVRLPDEGAAREVRSDTILTPRGGTGPAGAVRVVLINRDSQRHTAARPVQLTSIAPLPVQTWSATTDPFGCVVFPSLANGRYQVTINENGYVTPEGRQLFTETVSVDRLQPPPTLTVAYDLAGQVQLRFPNEATANRPAAAGMVLAHPGIRPLGALPSTSTSLSPLFPFAARGTTVPGPAAPYQGWLGRCQDADPVGYSGGSRASVPVDRSATSTVVAPSGTATVDTFWFNRNGNSDNGSNVAQASTWVRAVGSCGQKLTFLVPPSGSTTGARTNTSGRLVTSIPFGTWRFEVVQSRTSTGAETLCPLKPGTSWPTRKYTPAAPFGENSAAAVIVVEPSCAGIQ